MIRKTERILHTPRLRPQFLRLRLCDKLRKSPFPAAGISANSSEAGSRLRRARERERFMKRAFAPAPYGVVEKVPPRREGIPSIELFAVGTGLRACPFAGWSQSGQPRKGGQARRPVPTKPPRPSTPREPPCRCSRNRVFQQPLDRGYKKAMCPRRVEGALLFLTPLSRGGRGGCLYGVSLSRGLPLPFQGLFQQPPYGAFGSCEAPSPRPRR